MLRSRYILAFLLLFGLCSAAHAQGTTPLALAQQNDGNGAPLAGCLLYFYQAGTVATPQNAFADFGLTQPLPNPATCDQTGRVPMHWVANGLIHLRLTDASGVVQVDTTMQALGPSSGGGGGGGGGTVDPTTIASTGDIKFRPTSETLTGWVVLNGQTIGSSTSGATSRSNADTQNLFIYLWNNCPDAHCPVVGGRGASALADFNANKQITLYDMRDSILVGRDCMGVACAGGLLSSNITSGGGDGVDTPGAFGGAANLTLSLSNLPAVTLPVSVSLAAGQGVHSHTINFSSSGAPGSAGIGGGSTSGGLSTSTVNAALPAMSGTGTATLSGGGAAFSVMSPFKLGTWYQKL